MTRMETHCTECEHTPRSTSAYCPECGAEDPWDERPTYQFDPDDLPVIVSYEVYRDTWELWNEFTEEYFGVHGIKGDEVAGIPDEFPRLKVLCFEVYFVITPDYDLEGPFLERSAAWEVIDE